MRRLLNTRCILLLSQKHIKNKGYLLDHPPPIISIPGVACHTPHATESSVI